MGSMVASSMGDFRDIKKPHLSLNFKVREVGLSLNLKGRGLVVTSWYENAFCAAGEVIIQSKSRDKHGLPEVSLLPLVLVQNLPHWLKAGSVCLGLLANSTGLLEIIQGFSLYRWRLWFWRSSSCFLTFPAFPQLSPVEQSRQCIMLPKDFLIGPIAESALLQGCGCWEGINSRSLRQGLLLSHCIDCQLLAHIVTGKDVI